MSPLRRRSRGRSVIAALVSALALAGCASVDDPVTVGDPAATSEDGRTRLELWYQPNGLHPEQVMADELRRFEEEHPDVEVVATMVGWDATLTKLATATRSGVGPDVTFVGSAWVSDLVTSEVFHVFTDEELDRFGGAQRFHPAAWATGTDEADQIVAIPYLVETRLLFYRADLLAEVGIDPETDLGDWASLERTLRTLQVDSDASPWAIPGRNDWNVVHNALSWVWASGGEPSNDGGVPSLASEATVRSLSELQRLVSTYGDRDTLLGDTTDAEGGFVAGRYAMTINGPWLARSLTHRLPDDAWGAVPLPAGPDSRATLVGGSHLAVFEDSPSLDAAVDLVAFFARPESQARVAEQTRMVPARTDAEFDAPEADATRAALAAARPQRREPGWLAVEAALQRSLSRMWTNVEQGTPLSDEELVKLLRDVDAEVADVVERPGS